MNLILISCLLLFIIYFSIVGLLVYYFFCVRDIWNIFIDEIYQDFECFASSECSKHNIFEIFIPGFIYSNTASSSISIKDDECARCNECAREDKLREANLYNVKTLYSVYTLFKTLDANVIDDVNISNRVKMFQLLLEYIIRNYKELCVGDYTLYKKLQMVYLDKDKIKDKVKDKIKDKVNNAVSPRINNLLMGVEIIPILEEYSRILEKLDAICQQINIEMVHSTFMIGFYQDFRIFVIDARKYLLEFYN